MFGSPVAQPGDRDAQWAFGRHRSRESRGAALLESPARMDRPATLSTTAPPSAPARAADRRGARRPARADRLRAARSTGSTRTVARRRARLHLRRRHAHGDGHAARTPSCAPRCSAPTSPCPTASRSCGRSTCSATSSATASTGPTLMDRACARAARTGRRMYLYGGRRPGRARPAHAQPAPAPSRACRSSAATSPPFRELTRRGGGRRRGRHRALRRRGRVGRDRRAQAGEVDGADARAAAAPVLVGVGAAFDFHAGLIPQAPGWMQRLRARVGCSGSRRSRAGCGGATCATTRASWRLRAPVGARAPAAPLASRAMATTSRSSASAASACRSRSLRRRRPARARRRQGPERLDAVRSRRMPFKEPGTDELLARVDARRHRARATDAAESDAIVLTLGTPALSHIEIDMGDIRSVLDDLLPVLRAGPAARPALDRRARHDRVRRRLPGEAARLHRRRGRVRRPRARADRRRPLPGGDRDAAVHRRRRRRGLRRARRAAVRGARRADRADHAGAGRAGEDLDQHPALHDVRAPEPADDGLRALRRERVRRHRADQPRLSARRDGDAGPDGRHLPAQGLRVLGGEVERARACCSASRACTRACRCSSSTASSGGSAARCASARSPCSGSPSSATPTTSATRSRTS